VVGADGKIFVGSADTTVYAVLPSGKLFWAQKVGSKITTALAMGTDGALAVAAEQALVVLGR
jgi:outer membrane protein assembly factor BamB